MLGRCPVLDCIGSNSIIFILVYCVIFFASVGAWLSWVFYNSYLPDIAHPKQMDKASALGYSLGYVGSVLLLLVNLSMVLNPRYMELKVVQRKRRLRP